MSLNVGITSGLMDAGVAVAIGAWLYGAYHMLAIFTYFYVDSDADRARRDTHMSKFRRAGAVFIGMVFFVLIVGHFGRLD